MSLLQSLILGIIQGITEFLPISSSGHLIILPKIFNWPLQSLAFDAVLHLGTLVAVIFYFRDDVWNLIKSIVFYKDSDYKSQRKLVLMILIGIIPAGIAGFLFDGIIATKFRSINIVIFNLIFWGIFLIVADWYANKTQNLNVPAKGWSASGRKTQNHISKLKALTIGLFQVFSLIPGTSRSGVTIGAGVFVKLTKVQAARFSF